MKSLIHEILKHRFPNGDAVAVVTKRVNHSTPAKVPLEKKGDSFYIERFCNL